MGPVMIGGTGHSGTRALVNLCEAMGVWFPSEEEEGSTRDTLAYEPIMRDQNGKHMGSLAYQFAREWMTLERPPTPNDGLLYGQVRTFLELKTFAHLERVPKDYAIWGAKLPQFIMIMPVLADMFGQMKFIHVVRHCLRFENHVHWARTNTLAADFGELLGPDRYHFVRYEDLCGTPGTEIALLREYLKVDGDNDLKEMIQASRFEGHKAFNTAALLRSTGVPEVAVQAMRRFGYLE